MIVILEGLQGTGKTTICKEFEKEKGYLTHSTYHCSIQYEKNKFMKIDMKKIPSLQEGHIDWLWYYTLEQSYKILKPLENSTNIILVDRFAISQLVFGDYRWVSKLKEFLKLKHKTFYLTKRNFESHELLTHQSYTTWFKTLSEPYIQFEIPNHREQLYETIRKLSHT